MSRVFYTNDPLRDAFNNDRYMEKQLERLPKCSICGEHIQQEDAVVIDGNYYCDYCLEQAREEIDYE